MEMSSSGPPDKLNNLNKSDLSPHRDKDECSPVKIEAVDIHGEMSQRCVIIQKDEKGYGLIVSGDNPVFVQSVKEDGAAARAGVQQGDRIIKVNGTLVTQSNHQDVVELIKSAGSYVALTLLGKKPTGHGRTMSGTLQPWNISGSNMSGSHTIPGGKFPSPSERITGPQPVDPEKQQQLTNSRIHTIRKMLEKEVVYLENLKLEYSKTPSEKIQAEMIGAKKRVKTLEDQLFNLTGIPHDQIVPKSPKSPSSSHLRHYHSEKENRHSVISPPGGRSLIHQVSAPTLPPKPDNLLSLSQAKASVTSGEAESSADPNLLAGDTPQKSVAHASKPSLSSSLENIEKQVTCRTTTWPQVSPTHIRQSSGSDNVKKSLRHHKNAKMNASDSLYRSHSEASQHFRKSPVAEMMRAAEVNKKSPLSSPLGQNESTNESPVPSPPHSPPEYAEIQGGDSIEAFEGDDPAHEEYGTPPENVHTDINMHSVVTKLGIQNPSIICMEDDEFSSDTELGHLEDHGPYNGLWKLVRHSAHLAVFMHYLMSNSNSSSLFFYLISDMYEQGALKDMKKWAYEIHSSFLVPGAPMKVVSVDEAILHEIDDVLQNHIDKEETLRTVFRKARKKARKELNDLLAEFRNKRTIGLANIFSPPDYQLEEAMQNKSKEIALIEQILFPYFDNVPDDLDSMNDLQAAKIYSLATILKQFGTKSPPTLHLDRCPTFVSKEKSRIRFPQRTKKIISMQGHNFLPQHYYSVTYCNHCQLIIWGVGSQGYQCHNCEMNIHKSCVKVVEEHCIGAVRNKKDKRRDRMSGIRENLNFIVMKPRKPSQPVPAAIEKAKKMNDESNMENDVPYLNDSIHSENSHDPSERFADGKTEPKIISDFPFPIHFHHNDLEKLPFNKKNAGIGRSESFRQRRESRPSFRKRSDPNIPRSKSDVEVDEKSLNNSGSSSNSSLSNRSLDSPSTSSDMVHRTPSATTDSVPPNSATTSVPSPHTTSTPSTANSYDDSDLDAEADPPNWQVNVDWEVLRVMKPKEKKRQDVINELFHTERTHVRNLKVLDRIFYRPLVQEQLLPSDFLQLLFPNLEEVIELHCCFNRKMKTRRKEETIIGDIGGMMLEMFDGAAGEHLRKAAATFCQNHSIALESLKARQKKDQKLAQFLSDAELNNLCRRLQLKDIIASGFQRLTKYPLLLENIAKYTAPDTQELDNLLLAVERSKEILVYVDSAVKEAENLHRLSDIQKKLEKSAFEKMEKHPIVESFKNLDMTKHKLVYEGQLTWRLNKQKNIDMHVVLLEDILVLLQKQDEKYILKFHNTNLTSVRDDSKIMYSPILRIQNLLIRNNATDQRSIFLISSNELHAMYEFVAATQQEKKIWCRYLTEAVEVNTVHTGLSNKQPELVNDRNIVPSDEALSEESPSVKKESQSKQEDKQEISKNDKLLNNNSMESMQSAPSGQSSFDSSASSPAINANDNQTKEWNVVPPSSPEDNSAGAASKPQKRLQRVEILKIADGPQLIEPCEVIVNQGAVFQTAEPVLTPIERLKRKDQEIETAIQEKEKLVGDILQISTEDVFHTPEADDENAAKNAQELAVSAVHHANQLSLLLSECLNVPGEDFAAMHNLDGVWNDISDNVSSDSTPKAMRKAIKVPVASTDKLLQVSMSLNKKLTHLLAIISEEENERQQLRKELSNYREQVHLMHEVHRNCSVRSQSPSSYSQSRPNSFISIASSMSEDVVDAPEESLLSSVLNKVIEEPDGVLKQGDSSPTPVPSDNELLCADSVTDGQNCTSELPTSVDSVTPSDDTCIPSAPHPSDELCVPSAPPLTDECCVSESAPPPSDSLCAAPTTPVTGMSCDLSTSPTTSSNNNTVIGSEGESSTSEATTVTDTGDPTCV